MQIYTYFKEMWHLVKKKTILFGLFSFLHYLCMEKGREIKIDK